MANKDRVTSISAADVKNYAEANSDFSFEMAALRVMTQLAFACEHGGTYRDPATGKPREFDIRAISYQGSNYSYFPVECKNLRESSPFVVHTVPRPREDSFHQIICKPQDRLQLDSSYETKDESSGWRVVEIRGRRSRYQPGSRVGKHFDQISIQGDARVAKVQGREGNVFDKFSQALSSSADLVARATEQVQNACWGAALVPFLVVPDGRLWEIPYDESGKLVQDPHLVDHVTMLVRHPVAAETAFGRVNYTVSHLEIVTLSGLAKVVPMVRDSDFY